MYGTGILKNSSLGSSIYMYVVLLCHGSLLYSYAHVFIKRFWGKLFSTDVVETGIERLIVG